jgi:ankyrin repeat protein
MNMFLNKKIIYLEVYFKINNSYGEGIKQVCTLGFLDFLISSPFQKGTKKDYEYGFLSAVENGHLHIIQYLIHKKKVKASTFDSYSLVLAAEKGFVKIINYLLFYGADIKMQGRSAMLIACRNGHLKVVKSLVLAGTHWDFWNFWDFWYDNCISISATYGHLPIIIYLISKGANLHYFQEKALKIACEKGYFDIVKYLIDLGADFHIDNEEPLKMAVTNNHFEIANYLLKKGSMLSVFNEKDNLLLYAIYNENKKMIQCLLENGATVDMTLLEQAKYICDLTPLDDIFSLLMKHYANEYTKMK